MASLEAILEVPAILNDQKLYLVQAKSRLKLLFHLMSMAKRFMLNTRVFIMSIIYWPPMLVLHRSESLAKNLI